MQTRQSGHSSGLGTCLAEETETRPKPMVEIGGRPILWHIMMHDAHHRFKESLIRVGIRVGIDGRVLGAQTGGIETYTLTRRRCSLMNHEPKIQEGKRG